MNKLTQQEASDLIQKAWQEVSKHTLGSYRFGQALWDLIPNELSLGYWQVGYGYDGVDFFYEPNSNIATEKFYKYFVEGNDDNPHL